MLFYRLSTPRECFAFTCFLLSHHSPVFAIDRIGAIEDLNLGDSALTHLTLGQEPQRKHPLQLSASPRQVNGHGFEIGDFDPPPSWHALHRSHRRSNSGGTLRDLQLAMHNGKGMCVPLLHGPVE
jgi:hypothetical protein